MKVKLKEKTYDIEDPKKFFIDLLSFRSENSSYFPTDHWELVLCAIIGGMGSGKSTLLKFIAALGQKIYGSDFACFHTDDIIYTLNFLNEHKELRKKVLFLFIDDALTKPGADSRRSMSEENVKNSQNLSIIRHLLAQEDQNGNPNPEFKNGFCVIIYAVQDPGRLDVFIRRNLHIILYKTYYDSLEKTVDSDSLQFIREITEDSMYKHNYDVRGYALGITKTSGVMKMYFPRTEFQIPTIYSEPPNYSQIIDHVLKLDLEEVKDSILKGYIKEFCNEKKIKLDSKEIAEIIDSARYQQWKMKNSAENATEDRAQKELATEIDKRMCCATVHESLALGRTLDQICKKISKTKSWIEYNYPRWCSEMGIKPIKAKEIRKKMKKIAKNIPTEEE